jgi:SOS-response transcriptional repressor LexA
MNDKSAARDDLVFRFILEFKWAHDGNSPTIREIKEGCEMSSTSYVMFILRRLESRGLIECPHFGKNRMIVVSGGRWTHERL